MGVKPGYKQTDVGVIPEGWEVQHLGNVAAITTGRKDVNEGNPAGEYPFFTCSRTHTFSDRYSFDTEAIMIAGNGEVGNLHYYAGRFEAYQRTYVVHKFSLPVRYLWHQLDYRLTESLGLGKIGSSIPYIKKENLTGFTFPIPPTETEQHAIAEALSDVDTLMGSLDRLIAKKRDLKQAAMQQFLTGQTRLPGFHSEWSKDQLRSFVRRHNSGVYKSSELYGKGCNIVGVSDIYGIDSVDGQRFAQVPLSVAEQAKHTLETNDLVYGESSLVREGIARTVYVTKSGAGTAFAWHTRRYSVNENVLLSSYLYYYLQGRCARKHMIDHSIQTAITGINTAAYFACPVLIPPLPEQTAIAEVLTDMDGELAALEQRREKTSALKQAMMQELLTGRTRLI